MALNVTKVTLGLAIIAIASAATIAAELYRLHQIKLFNAAVSNAQPPQSDEESYEAKFAVAYWQAQKGKYQEATLLFGQLNDQGTDTQKSAVQYNLGNIFFLRGLAINGTSMAVRDQAEFLLTQAKTAYQQSLRLDNRFWDAQHNLDRVLTMLPAHPTPGTGNSDSPGLIMGNIPVGLP